MAKFKIDPNPTFKADVKIPRIGAEPITVPFTFKVLQRTTLAALYDKWSTMTKEFQEQEVVSFTDMAEADIKLQVERIKDIVVSWAFEDPYTDENIRALVETSVQAAESILEAYQEAYSEVRRGK